MIISGRVSVDIDDEIYRKNCLICFQDGDQKCAKMTDSGFFVTSIRKKTKVHLDMFNCIDQKVYHNFTKKYYLNLKNAGKWNYFGDITIYVDSSDGPGLEGMTDGEIKKIRLKNKMKIHKKYVSKKFAVKKLRKAFLNTKPK